MSNNLAPLILDVVVLVFLAATIFYAWQLSRKLNEFKAQRQEFDGVITSLLAAINQAQKSIATLKDVSGKEASELEHLIHRSQQMSEELKIINEAGESMAKRLEKLAETNRQIVQENNLSSSSISNLRSSKKESKIRSRVSDRDYKDTLKSIKSVGDDIAEKDLPSFMIKDREHDSHSDDGVAEFESKAEKELFQALKKGKRQVSGEDT
ncbi:MAG: hypothetical protein GC137_00580 [Alphaproteobacteria bacterium]|nr:hypothetical protein [Alphaproteobacteria bacterium]